MNNPSAFPYFGHTGWSQGNGMTLRDYFAAKAMQAMETRNASGTDHSRAIRAYEMADAMMKAREQ
jgi:histidinol phosphatase-like PHP family hydrolase